MIRVPRSAAIGLVVLLVSCGSSTITRFARERGDALRPYGLQQSGPLGFDPPAVHIGREYGFAFPQFDNRSTAPVTLQRVSVVHVPAHVDIVKYGVLSVRDTDGFVILSSAIHSDTDTDYARLRDYPLRTFTIAAGRSSQLYAVVWVRVTGPVRSQLSTCRVDYRQGPIERFQNFYCQFSLNGK